MQGDDETNSIITKTGNYLIDLFFDIYKEKDSNDKEEEIIGNQACRTYLYRFSDKIRHSETERPDRGIEGHDHL